MITRRWQSILQDSKSITQWPNFPSCHSTPCPHVGSETWRPLSSNFWKKLSKRLSRPNRPKSIRWVLVGGKLNLRRSHVINHSRSKQGTTILSSWIIFTRLTHTKKKKLRSQAISAYHTLTSTHNLTTRRGCYRSVIKMTSTRRSLPASKAYKTFIKEDFRALRSGRIMWSKGHKCHHHKRQCWCPSNL